MTRCVLTRWRLLVWYDGYVGRRAMRGNTTHQFRFRLITSNRIAPTVHYSFEEGERLNFRRLHHLVSYLEIFSAVCWLDRTYIVLLFVR